jgi:hypothetical protein
VANDIASDRPGRFRVRQNGCFRRKIERKAFIATLAFVFVPGERSGSSGRIVF